jgi:hypothetical protein
MKYIKAYFFPVLIVLVALAVSGSAAFFSVSGLSKLFAGAATEVLIMAGSLEVAKLVVASLLHKYWDTINKGLRTYLTTATIVLVIITSMGIYGFLSAAYQETYNKFSILENQKEFLQEKESLIIESLDRVDRDLQLVNSTIATLSQAKSQQIQVRDTNSATGFRTTVSTAELRLAQQRLTTEEAKRTKLEEQRQPVLDSLQTIKLAILDLENSSEVSAELGPLQYLSNLLNRPMDQIINVLLLVIIFVFDPLAVSLIIAANFAFSKIVIRKDLYNETEVITEDFSNLYQHEEKSQEEEAETEESKGEEHKEKEIREEGEVKEDAHFEHDLPNVSADGGESKEQPPIKSDTNPKQKVSPKDLLKELKKNPNSKVSEIDKIISEDRDRKVVRLKNGEIKTIYKK